MTESKKTCLCEKRIDLETLLKNVWMVFKFVNLQIHTLLWEFFLFAQTDEIFYRKKSIKCSTYKIISKIHSHEIMAAPWRHNRLYCIVICLCNIRLCLCYFWLMHVGVFFVLFNFLGPLLRYISSPEPVFYLL